MVDVKDPKNPKFAGCYAEDGYTHDAQCVIYNGPDTKYQGREVCFNFNENTLTLVDVTNRTNPVMISKRGYEDYSYTHQVGGHLIFLFIPESFIFILPLYTLRAIPTRRFLFDRR